MHNFIVNVNGKDTEFRSYGKSNSLGIVSDIKSDDGVHFTTIVTQDTLKLSDNNFNKLMSEVKKLGGSVDNDILEKIVMEHVYIILIRYLWELVCNQEEFTLGNKFYITNQCEFLLSDILYTSNIIHNDNIDILHNITNIVMTIIGELKDESFPNTVKTIEMYKLYSLADIKPISVIGNGTFTLASLIIIS